ncbi:hypothetical protein M9H77_34357 [Catharanthus roseus]|uniref:Uncharacterized protein n=1 Tax=Catharanthus roseus TaxID=4058 RepID=A0ACB9ZKY4_CATRO|nr:hypothetical protein M9H77_34357 [Catharanthus roseus]
MATSENWQLFVHNRRHNHKIVVYHHDHAQAARLAEEQLQQTEQFRKSYIKKNRMQGRNTVEEVLCLSAQRGYTVFYRNCEESYVLSDIVVAHPTSIAIIRMWPNVQYPTIGSCRDDSDRRHIDQNVLAKLTEMVKDEEVA